MIEKVSKIKIHCDYCHNTEYPYEIYNMRQSIKYARQQGWIMKKDDHMCGVCRIKKENEIKRNLNKGSCPICGKDTCHH